MERASGRWCQAQHIDVVNVLPKVGDSVALCNGMVPCLRGTDAAWVTDRQG